MENLVNDNEKNLGIMDHSPKKAMSHEERLQLAAKLDKELDEFIEKLPKKKYQDGWPEDRWEEEMDRHPFFMKEPPKPGQELHPLLEGLQALKYDPNENEPEDLATSYKDDGNFNFKHKNYRLAIIAYTEGIKVKCQKSEINANLYNNRSAAHYFLKNFRSSLKDCEAALKLNPRYDKALIRAANCCYELKQYTKCMEYCDEVLSLDKSNTHILELKKKCINEDKIKQRNERKKDLENRKLKRSDEQLVNEILKRGYRIVTDHDGTSSSISIENLEPFFPQLVHNRVHLDKSGNLVWPVILVYPEYQIMDYIQEFNETNLFIDQLSQVFEVPPEWDKENKYMVSNLNVFVETAKQKVIKVDINSCLKNVLTENGIVIKCGTPSFIVLVKDSAAEEKFLAQY